MVFLFNNKFIYSKVFSYLEILTGISIQILHIRISEPQIIEKGFEFSSWFAFIISNFLNHELEVHLYGRAIVKLRCLYLEEIYYMFQQVYFKQNTFYNQTGFSPGLSVLIFFQNGNSAYSKSRFVSLCSSFSTSNSFLVVNNMISDLFI